MHQTIAREVAPPRSAVAVVLPTAAAGAALRRTLTRLAGEPPSAELLTRDALYLRLHEHYGAAAGSTSPMLSAFEREVLLSKAAWQVHAATPAPFRLRPGLIVEILGFYDELRRRDRTVADFARLMTDSLQSSIEIDRGAERLFRQTQFLSAAFTAFEVLVRDSRRLDEHALRAALLAGDSPCAFRHLILTVADQAADPRGFWTADYDLIARLHGVETIDVIATENVLASGFHQRIHDLLPGIEEERAGAASAPAILMAPPRPAGDAPVNWFVHP